MAARMRRVRAARTPITMPAIAPPERVVEEEEEEEEEEPGRVEVPRRVMGMMWGCISGDCQVHWEREKFLRS